jgi:hypothetical protein
LGEVFPRLLTGGLGEVFPRLLTGGLILP